MKERYSITLQVYVQIDAANGVAWIEEDYDLTKLIPGRLRGKKFMLYSSFDTGNAGTDVASGIAVSITTLPQTYC